MIHSTATYILPYIEQNAVYDMFDIKSDPIVAYAATPSGDAFKTATGCLLHQTFQGAQLRRPRASSRSGCGENQDRFIHLSVDSDFAC